MLAKPVEHRRHRGGGALGLLAALGCLPAPDPAGKLALEIPRRAAEAVEPDLTRRDEMEVGQRVDQGLPDAPVERGPAREFGRDVVADHKPAAPLLDDEDRANDAFVLAQQQAARRWLIAPVEHRKDAMLPAHVVRPWRDRAQGWPSQHEFPGAEAQKISQIGLAARKLAHRKRPFGARQIRAKIRLKPGRAEALVGTLVDQLGRFERRLHQRPASFETAPRASSESGLKWVMPVQLLASLRVSSRMWARSSHAVALVTVASKSLARRRLRPSQAKVRSTTQRRGSSWKPLTPGGRSTISIVHGPQSATAACSCGPR